jgi:hypothetical protein
MIRGWLARGAVAFEMTLLLACAPKGGTVAALAADEFRVTGMVSKSEVGANCWRFAGPDGKGYELRPDQAPAEVLVDGRSATLILKARSDLMSTCMVGQIVDVVRVEPSPAR